MQGSIHLFERLPQVNPHAEVADDVALAPVRARPVIGLIRNARSHRNENGSAQSALPDGVIARSPQKRSELTGILAEFAEKRVDCIAIDGGDGTVRDVLTSGAGVFGDAWPAVIVIPNGKTNALALDLGLPTDWSLAKAMEALAKGNAVIRQPLVVTQRDNPSAQVRGFIMGGGVFNRCIALGQQSHKLGAFNAAVVGVTAVWSVLQALLGSAGNGWRQGTKMRVSQSNGQELDHRGGLPRDERYLLFATTLRNLPAGLDPFRGVDDALRLTVLDNPSRAMLLRIGAVMRGTASEATHRRGVHVLGDESFDIDLGESFILDGEAFPAGQYRITAGTKLRFVVP